MSKDGAGKGDDIREGFNYRNYWTNFPVLTGDHERKPKKIEKKKGKTRYTYR